MISPLKRFICQKVLPTVYDDALSYYEVLGKITAKLNELIENVNTLNESVSEIVESISGFASKEYVDGAVDGLASESYVDNAVDGLATETYVDNSVAGLATESALTDGLNSKADKSNPYFTGAGHFSGDVYANSSKKLATEEYLMNKFNQFTGNDATFQANVYASGNKKLATEDYVNNAVAGATGATVATGTFTPSYTPSGTQYMTIKQIGSVVYIHGCLKTSQTWGDELSELGVITGVPMPTSYNAIPAITEGGFDQPENCYIIFNDDSPNGIRLLIGGVYDQSHDTIYIDGFYLV